MLFVFSFLSGKNADDTKTGKVVPTFSIAFQNPATGDPVTTGTVGTEVKLVISIPVAEYGKDRCTLFLCLP